MSYESLYESSFKEFVASLLTVLDDHAQLVKIKDLLDTNKFKIDRHRKYYLAQLREHEPLLLKKDNALFQRETPLALIPTVDFVPIWRKLEDADRNACWKHLQSLYMIAQQVENPGTEEIQKMMEVMQASMGGGGDAAAAPTAAQQAGMAQTASKLDGLMNDRSNPLVSLAMDITDELMSGDSDIANLSQEDFMRSMMNPGGGGGFQGLMGKVQAKIDSRVKDGKLDLESMEGSAQGMMEQLQGILPGGMGGMANMMSQMGKPPAK